MAQPVESFDAFKDRMETVAVANGIGRDFYRAVMGPVQPDPSIPSLISGQPEFVTPVWEYLDARIGSGRIGRGQAAVAANGDLLGAIGQRYGVDPYVLAAIWGMESDYGAVLSNRSLIKPIIASLATLAHQRRGRVAEDEAELIAALRIAQARGSGEGLVGSWAGALGHLQLIPTAYLQYGQDGDGDGVVDPHTSLADALASSANYLRGLGYQPGLDWGFEVDVPEGFDYLLADRDIFRPISFFAERGVARVAGRSFSDPGTDVFLYVPAGAEGPKFLMTRNYLVFKGYNFSDSYAMAVAHLTDRLKGGGAFVTPWPRGAQFPNRQQRIDIQTMLARLGYYQGVVDGNIGPVTQAAYARFQADAGLVADGFVTLDAHQRLRDAL
ncbi:membrane-bound lytic murein transglycosylase B precursor [Pelagibacterium halotolerans B2]|uniref:Membrane-bound lytic murein transglycosylase B n=1 Tax=Pelagibacterium halotolerans (strain DSM 22347 / JCM 15775 / CGMCC 1.7692 / B2) TaxID=1082931 RepID=G4RC98_PELHB|nr:membrane-bound lytic murein transglycosylase B precursor [Pelagibacterium halotolerans B2]